MEKTTIGVREVDEETFRKFRALAVANKLRLGEALTEAMKKLMKEKHTNIKRDKVKYLLEVKPFNWGRGTEKTSNEIDEILYEFKK